MRPRSCADAGFDGVRLLVMGALSPIELDEALAAEADVVVWSEQMVGAVAQAGGGRVHVKLDSGMGRLGTRDPEQGAARGSTCRRDCAGRVGRGNDSLRDRRRSSTTSSLHASSRRSAAGPSELKDVLSGHRRARGQQRRRCCASRAPTSTWFAAASAYTGWTPSGATRWRAGSTLPSSWSPIVAEVKDCAPGQSAGYGRRFVAEQQTLLGVLPIGYGDGWRRALSNNGDVLVGGQRRPIVGTVSMDNLTVDLGVDPDARTLAGGETVLIGARGDQRITAEEVAQRMDTINYEVTCALTGRVPRVYHRDGANERRGARDRPFGA